MTVTSGVCTRILQSQFTDPIVSRDLVMHYWDPIVFPGVYGYFVGGPAPFNTGTHGPAHWHNFFGNVSLNPRGIQDPNAATTCTGGFRGSLWAPNLLGHQPGFPERSYIPVPPRTMTYSYQGTIPAGFGAIAREVTWDCGAGTTKTAAPHLCPGKSVQSVTRFRSVGISMKVRSDFGLINFTFDRLTVGGVTIAAQQPDGTWVETCDDSGDFRCEDELSFHMDVLFP